MARGLDTLWYKRHLMNPLAHGGFAWKLISHKLFRWLVFLTLPGAFVGLGILALTYPLARVFLGLAVGGCLVGGLAMIAANRRAVPRLVSIFAFLFAANLAGVLAWIKALRGERNPIWEPTRRPV
jgi:hypothetical protein